MFRDKKSQKLFLLKNEFHQVVPEGKLKFPPEVNPVKKLNQPEEKLKKTETPLFCNKPFKFKGKRLDYQPINKNVN